jgi:prepilin-type N-terminal cleavage/methylation domain-containing protein/prepilin-type processing-associated H-X9-DG protein
MWGLNRRHGFSLIELIVVMALIALLIAMLFPALRSVRLRASAINCSSNLRQVALALQMYVNENRGNTFWRGSDIDIDGMDWYVYGGRETTNLNKGQNDLFNRVVPRPLNKYAANTRSLFHCPCDDAAPWTLDASYTPYPAPSQFEWVGNSYNFNANGYPLRPAPRQEGGLDGVKYATISNPSQTILFYEACLYWGYNWHFGRQGNIAFVDGHVEFTRLPPWRGTIKWDP